MFKKIRNIFIDLSDSQQAVINIIGVITMIAIGAGTAFEWLRNLSVISKIWYSLAVLCLILIFIIAFVTWWRKHNIGKIPLFLANLDNELLSFVSSFDIKKVDEKDSTAVAIDIGEIIGIDVWRTSNALAHKDKRILAEQMKKGNQKILKNIDPNEKSHSSLQFLMTISGIMNQRGVGLDKLKETENYQSTYKKVKQLQKLVPSAEMNIRINEYFNWSTALYSLLLGYKFIENNKEMLELLPVKERASTHYIQPYIEQSTETLISAVRESFEKYQRNKD